MSTMDTPLPTAPDLICIPPIEPVAPPNGPRLGLRFAVFNPDRDHVMLDDATFRLVTVAGSETVSEPFEFKLELHANDTWRAAPEQQRAIDSVLGCRIAFAIHQPTGSGSPPADQAISAGGFWRTITAGSTGTPASWISDWSFFSGIVAHVGLVRRGVYEMTMRPALWLLTLANGYRLLKGCSVRDAIAGTLQRHGVTADFKGLDQLATSPCRDWLQCGETDYEFVQRLMRRAHLYYYFRHTPAGHTVVFGNGANYPDPVWPASSGIAPERPFRYAATDATPLGLQQWDVIEGLRYDQNLGVAAVHAHFVRHYDASLGDEALWQLPLNRFQATSGPDGTAAGLEQYKVFQLECDSDLAADFAGKTLSSAHATSHRLAGKGCCAGLRPGHWFRITASPWIDNGTVPIWPSLDAQRFVVTQARYQASADGTFTSSFQATLVNLLVGGFSMSHTQQGSVLAIVVEPPAKDQSSSYKYLKPADLPTQGADLNQRGVYVVLATDETVATPVFVKISASMQSTPAIGSVVMVGRSSDESELPEIQQTMYSLGSRTATPDGWTAHTSFGSSYSTRYGDGLNISFGRLSAPDLASAVAVVTQAYALTAPLASRGAEPTPPQMEPIPSVVAPAARLNATPSVPGDQPHIPATPALPAVAVPTVAKPAVPATGAVATQHGSLPGPAGSTTAKAGTPRSAGSSPNVSSAQDTGDPGTPQRADTQALGGQTSSGAGATSGMEGSSRGQGPTTPQSSQPQNAPDVTAKMVQPRVATAPQVQKPSTAMPSGMSFVPQANTIHAPTAPSFGFATGTVTHRPAVAPRAAPPRSAMTGNRRLFSSASYSQGASYSFSTADPCAPSARQDLPTTFGPEGADATDVLSVSESFGSSFSRSQGAVQSSISDIGTSYSKNTVGTSKNYSTTTGTAMSQSTNLGDVSNYSVINANSTSCNHTDGLQINVSNSMGGQMSSTNIVGGQMNVTNVVGGSASVTTIVGAQTSTTNIFGLNEATTLVMGDSTNASVTLGTSMNANALLGVSNNTNLTAVQLSTDITGVRTGVSLVGSATDTNLTGMRTVTDICGMANAINVTGMSQSINCMADDTSVHVIGVSDVTRLYGTSNDLTFTGGGISISIGGPTTKIEVELLSLEMPETLKIVM